MRRLASLPRYVAAAACCFALISCSDEVPLELAENTVEGAITYKGKPVPYAVVILSDGKQSASGTAANDGTYKIEHVPVGTFQVGVNTEAGRGVMQGALMAARQTKTKVEGAKFVDIPKKFHEPTTSGITTTIKEGANKYDIKIE